MAAAAAAVTIDEVVRDVFTEAASEEERGRLASVSLDTIPEDVDAFVDWITVVSILSRQTQTTGIIDLRLHCAGCSEDSDAPHSLACAQDGDGTHGHDTGDCPSWSYKINGDGRISELTIVGCGVFYLRNMTTTTSEVTTAAVTTDAENKERDNIIRDVLAETAEEDRGRLMSVCVGNCPTNVAFIDFVVVISILSRGGVINIERGANNNFNFGSNIGFGDGWLFLTNEDGRIRELNVGGYAEDEDGIHDIASYCLPAGVTRLQQLDSLEVIGNCRSLPIANLCSLPHLQELCLNRCSDLLEKFPIGMTLPRLKRLYLRGCRLKETASSQLFAWMASQLPVLERLAFHYIKEMEPECILDALRSLEFPFQNTLKRINFIGCPDLGDDHLALLFRVVTKFPNFYCLDLEGNNIRSVRPLVEKIKQSDNDGCGFVSKSICCMDLFCNPIMENVRKDPEEKKALLSFLRTFNTIYNLGVCSCNSDVEYALRMNQAGRRVVEVGDVGAGNRFLPLAGWPAVLERSYAKSGEIYHRRGQKNATGLYYLLREGPALIGRPALGSTVAMEFDCNFERGSDHEHEHDNYGNDNPSKRRRIEKPKAIGSSNGIRRLESKGVTSCY